MATTMESHVKSIVCSTCLSSNRRFVRDKTLVDVAVWFPKYLQLNLDTDQICWECHAVLVKLMKFRSQALAARQMLNNILTNKEGTPKSLSSLELNEITCYRIYPAQIASSADTCETNQQRVAVRSLSSLTENVTTPNVTTVQLLSTDSKFTDAESHLTKFTIKNFKEDSQFLEFNVNICESVRDVLRTNLGKESFGNRYIPIVDMRHMSIKNTKRKELRKDKVTQSDQCLDNFNLNDHSYYKRSNDFKKINNNKNDSSKAVASNKLTRKKKRNLVLKDIRIYNNVIEVDMSETELQTLRMKEKDSECFLAAKFKCDKCIFGYQEERLYKAHLNKHKESYGPHECGVCELRFREEETLYSHYSNHYKAFACAVCRFSSRFLQTVLANCRDTGCSPPRPLATTCADCGSYFTEESELTLHRAVAHRGPIECRQCGKRFANTYKRTMHERCHSQARVECEVCHKTVLGARGLYSHMRYIHAQQPAQYCSLCKKFFKSKTTYETHLKTTARHTTQQYQCDHCGKSMCSKTYLADHIMRLHLRVRRFACSLCDKKYTRNTDLHIHTLKKHSGRARHRTHMCSECGKAYETSAILKIHSLTHTGLKPHQCAHCPWRFTQKSTLVTHVKLKHKDVVNVNQPPGTT